MKFLKSVLVVALFVGLVNCSKSNKPPTVNAPVVAPDRFQVAKDNAAKSPNFENFIALGLVMSNANRHDEALAAFKRAAEISPKAALAFNNICSTYNALGSWVLAIENCEKALQLQPGYALASGNLANALSIKAAQQVRIAELEKNIRDGKEEDKNRVDLGMIYYTRGDYERATTVWKVITEKSDQFAVSQNNLASAYILMKKYDLAKTYLDKALEKDPTNQLYINNRAWLQSTISSSSR